ncbi:hypothetical protein [uncultured Thiocystis sp.]|jgi:hypothetical protein|uniref:hypothetical protein n=1 Tax=uncultured Thiocystis sp. TaxID=1202134 RepID=UPI0025EA5A66|nr:hypothetical protein [uncultured Thiocystis sp.]
MNRIPQRRRAWLAALIFALPCMLRAEIQISGFATLGAAISDQDFVYQRYIDDHGTLNRDSLLGLQLDAQLADAWSLTLQAKAAPSTHSDTGWEPTLSWAFLSWRPDNDLLLRAGKLRLPLMFYSANSDVGTTFDFARLPTELYSLIPTTDVKGLSVARTWLDGEREWTLEGYVGRAHSDWRYFLREDIPPDLPDGPLYIGVDMDLAGLVLSLRDGENVLRAGLHHSDLESDYGPLPVTSPFVPIAPGIGYYKLDGAMPGPPVPTVDRLRIDVLTLGAEIALPHDFRLVGEYGRRRITNSTMGPDTSAGYLALLKRVGRWTPYVYWAGIRTQADALGLYTAVNNNRVPDVIPGAAAINASQRTGADLNGAFDQYSLAIGTAYRLSPTSKLKAEWLHTQTGSVSSFVDPPADEDSGGRQVNVFSLSYNVTF